MKSVEELPSYSALPKNEKWLVRKEATLKAIGILNKNSEMPPTARQIRAAVIALLQKKYSGHIPTTFDPTDMPFELIKEGLVRELYIPSKRRAPTHYFELTQEGKKRLGLPLDEEPERHHDLRVFFPPTDPGWRDRADRLLDKVGGKASRGR